MRLPISGREPSPTESVFPISVRNPSPTGSVSPSPSEGLDKTQDPGPQFSSAMSAIILSIWLITFHWRLESKLFTIIENTIMSSFRPS